MVGKFDTEYQHHNRLGLHIFSNEDLHKIHAATLEVLEKTGIFVENANALELFERGYSGGRAIYRQAQNADQIGSCQCVQSRRFSQ